MTSTKTILKACPFCGGDAVLMSTPIHGYEPCVEYHVSCTKCHWCDTRASKTDTVYQSEDVAIKNAIQTWNTRA